MVVKTVMMKFSNAVNRSTHAWNIATPMLTKKSLIPVNTVTMKFLMVVSMVFCMLYSIMRFSVTAVTMFMNTCFVIFQASPHCPVIRAKMMANDPTKMFLMIVQTFWKYVAMEPHIVEMTPLMLVHIPDMKSDIP